MSVTISAFLSMATECLSPAPAQRLPLSQALLPLSFLNVPCSAAAWGSSGLPSSACTAPWPYSPRPSMFPGGSSSSASGNPQHPSTPQHSSQGCCLHALSPADGQILDGDFFSLWNSSSQQGDLAQVRHSLHEETANCPLVPCQHNSSNFSRK